MPDMLVNLLALPEQSALQKTLEDQGIQIRRALAPDQFRIVEWVKEHNGISAAGECSVCFSRIPVSCFIATEGARIVGYACYHAIAPDFFGPTLVLEECRGQNVGKALLIACLQAMRAEGYVYGIIGGIGPQVFYEKTVGAQLIPHSTPGIYKDFLGGMKKES